MPLPIILLGSFGSLLNFFSLAGDSFSVTSLAGAFLELISILLTSLSNSFCISDNIFSSCLITTSILNKYPNFLYIFSNFGKQFINLSCSTSFVATKTKNPSSTFKLSSYISNTFKSSFNSFNKYL